MRCVTSAHQCRRESRLVSIHKPLLAIAAQTAKGAAKMLLEEKIHPEQLSTESQHRKAVRCWSKRNGTPRLQFFANQRNQNFITENKRINQ